MQVTHSASRQCEEALAAARAARRRAALVCHRDGRRRGLRGWIGCARSRSPWRAAREASVADRPASPPTLRRRSVRRRRPRAPPACSSAASGRASPQLGWTRRLARSAGRPARRDRPLGPRRSVARTCRAAAPDRSAAAIEVASRQNSAALCPATIRSRRRSVRWPAGRRQDHHHRQDCGAGARPARPQLSMLAADAFRVGAVEQLRLTPTSSAARSRWRGRRRRSSGARRDGRPMLVDTAGRSTATPGRSKWRSGCRRCPACAPTWCCRPDIGAPGSAAARRLRRAARRVVMTRLDEAESVAPLLRLLAERDLTFSYLGRASACPKTSNGPPARRWLGTFSDGRPEGLAA